MNDAELLRRYVEDGSQEAFAELVRLRIGLVYSAALQQTGGDPHRAQEVTQAVFTDMARKASSLCRHTAPIGWLYTSVRYTAAKLARSERRRRAREQEAHIMHEDLLSPAPENPGERLRPLLYDAMHRLPEADRRALLLRFFDGCSMAELGGCLGLSESTAKKRVERALGKLRGVLAGRGMSSTAAAVGAALSQEAVAATAPAGLAASVSGSALVAASTAAPGLGVLSLMTASKFTTAVGAAAILGLISIGAGIHEWRQARRSGAALEAAAKSYEVEQDQLQDLLRKTTAADKALAELQKEADATGKAADQSTATAAREKADWQRLAAAHPEVRNMMGDFLKAMGARNYGLYVARGDLTPEQFEKLTGSWLDSDIQNLGLRPAGGVEVVGDNWSDDKTRAIIGDQAFRRLQDADRVVSVTPVISDVATSAGYAGEPLSSDQEVKLTQIIAANSPRYQNGGSVDRNSVDWTNVASKAQSMLSPSQWKSAEGVFLSNQYQAALSQAQQSQSANAKPDAGAGGN